MVDNIRNNTTSEIDSKIDINEKYEKRKPGHKKLLNSFNDLLDRILTEKTLESEN